MTKQKINLANFIAAQREKLGNISQVELAKKCGVPAGTIASIESGYAKSPRPVTLKKLAEGLVIPEELIFKLASNPEKEIVVDTEEVKTFKIPYFGNIPSNNDFKNLDNPDENYIFPMEFLNEGDFIVSISGDSLTTEDIYDGDYIVITKQDFLKRSGDLMLVRCENLTTLLRIYKEKNNYKINGKTCKKEDLIFIGKAAQTISRRIV